jgi:hypothetical protein
VGRERSHTYTFKSSAYYAHVERTVGYPVSMTLSDIRMGVVRGISYGLFGAPDAFAEPARDLGARLQRVYVYWSQVQPRPGQWAWDTVDAILAQTPADTELWLTVCSSSPWATRTATDFLPPSPAKDLATYRDFVGRLVGRCRGRVRFWQCDNEPSNAGLLWAGTAEEYVAQLSIMYGAVKREDRDAFVVLGGCGYDALTCEPDDPPRLFFDQVVDEGRDAFDLFSVNLYGDPARVPEFIGTARELMRRHGYVKPVVVGEHGGPVPFEFPEAEAAMGAVLAGAFTEHPGPQSSESLKEQQGLQTPEVKAMTALYQRAAHLPPRLAMFLEGCPPELEARRHRINCRQLVTRTLLALSQDVKRIAYWNLAVEVPAKVDPLQMMHLFFGKLTLLEYEDGVLKLRRPAADTFALLEEQLAGATAVRRTTVDERPSLYAVEVDRPERGPLLVLWERREAFDGETLPPDPIEWPWADSSATAVDVFGVAVPFEVQSGQIRLSISDTPVFLSSGFTRAAGHGS